MLLILLFISFFLLIFSVIYSIFSDNKKNYFLAVFYIFLFTTTTIIVSFLAYKEEQFVIAKDFIVEAFERTELDEVFAEKVMDENDAEDEQDQVVTNTKELEIKDKVFINVPLIEQLPELPRGCEVTSLNMLLTYYNIKADKMTLAKEIKHNPNQHRIKNGKTHFGNPHNGFVGDMYSFDTPGLGVYHKPIKKLAESYAEELKVVDFTGEDFDEVRRHLSQGRPVWVIINSHYKTLPKSQFETWHTEDGPIDITYRQHSVLITGYDKDKVYFNDPLNYRSDAPIEGFIDAWSQMGKQAITIYE